jgi:hypothetical protein
MKKRFLVAVTLVVMFSVLVSVSPSAEFWASKNSNKYHYPNCRWAQKIKSENLIKFNSPEEAAKAGYVPCRVCKPPLPKKAELKLDDYIDVPSCKHSSPVRALDPLPKLVLP